ncbi:MAG: CHAD domain-containing protein [Bacteroidales bacterium]|nr:CHAD domain-containing protein [Bacteroidales bacterium]
MKHPVIQLQSSLENNVKSILLHYNNAAIDFLSKNLKNPENIHQTRLCFKRIRSFLRLSRTAFADGIFQELNIYYRDQGRLLSSNRDITAIIDIGQDMLIRGRSDSVKLFLKRYIQAQKRNRKQTSRNPDLQRNTQTMIDSLRETANKISSLEISGETHKCLAFGAKKVYKKGFHLLETVRKTREDHLLHEWRKQVKYLWYHYVFLNSFWPGIMGAHARQTQQLSQWLGKYHDYVILENDLLQSGSYRNNKNQPKTISRNIKRSKEKLAQHSIKLGQKIYLLSPASFEFFMEALLKLERGES